MSPVTDADSAGVPWKGRTFEPNPSADDDGSARPALLAVLGEFRRGSARAVDVVDVLRSCRLLIPLVADVGDGGSGVHGLAVDKSADLSIVTVAGPDGRAVLPVFSSVEAMARWNPTARPVPSDAVRVALAAASDGTQLVVLDPGSETEFAIRRPAVWAIAQQREWSPSWSNASLAEEFAASVADESEVTSVRLAAGDATARLVGPELLVTLVVRPGLDEAELTALLARLQERWASSAGIAERVDSIAVRLERG